MHLSVVCQSRWDNPDTVAMLIVALTEANARAAVAEQYIEDLTAIMTADDQAALDEVKRQAWNDGIEAAAEKCDVATMDHIGDIVRGIGDDIRALRRDGGK